jgi:hypothetical protein
MRRLRAAAGCPSLRAICDASQAQGRIARSTLQLVLAGRRLPGAELLAAFADVCGAGSAATEALLAARSRILNGPPPRPRWLSACELVEEAESRRLRDAAARSWLTDDEEGDWYYKQLRNEEETARTAMTSWAGPHTRYGERVDAPHDLQVLTARWLAAPAHDQAAGRLGGPAWTALAARLSELAGPDDRPDLYRDGALDSKAIAAVTSLDHLAGAAEEEPMFPPANWQRISHSSSRGPRRRSRRGSSSTPTCRPAPTSRSARTGSSSPAAQRSQRYRRCRGWHNTCPLPSLILTCWPARRSCEHQHLPPASMAAADCTSPTSTADRNDRTPTSC